VSCASARPSSDEEGKNIHAAAASC